MNASDKASARFIAFYLPQYHPIPENDKWWGPGFTEWTNVARARPLFPGHRQPLIPGSLGFYDLRLSETREEQADLAREFGVEGLCYWHYWFGNGDRILERPFEEVLSSKKPNLPFCIGWANHTWAGHWIGAPHRTLKEQKYLGKEDWIAHFNCVVRAFVDPRYITVSGKPIFLIYRCSHIPETQNFMEVWNDLATKAGLPGIYFIGMRTFLDRPQELMRFYDATMMIRPTFRDRYMPRAVLSHRFRLGLPNLQSYRLATAALREKKGWLNNDIPCVFPSWDNTPRSRLRGHVYLGSSPSAFGEQIGVAWDLVRNRPSQERLIFVRSWNEWAEGNILEPDAILGTAYLGEIRNFLSG